MSPTAVSSSGIEFSSCCLTLVLSTLVLKLLSYSCLINSVWFSSCSVLFSSYQLCLVLKLLCLILVLPTGFASQEALSYSRLTKLGLLLKKLCLTLVSISSVLLSSYQTGLVLSQVATSCSRPTNCSSQVALTFVLPTVVSSQVALSSLVLPAQYVTQ